MPTKTSSIISTVLTVLTLLVIGAASMFFLLVALNGFSGSAGEPGLITSLVCNVIGIILAAILAWRLPRWLIGKFNWNSIVAVIVSVLAGLFVGSGLSAIALFIGVLVADSIWKAR